MSEIFLDYGVDANGELVYIGQVGRGRVALACPYCGVTLIARKGEKVAPHFAHDGQTCRSASRDRDVIALPAFDKFDFHLPGRVLEALRSFGSGSDPTRGDTSLLKRHELISFNRFAGRGGAYELTHLGELILGRLSLDLFNRIQEPLIVEKHEELLKRATIAQGAAGRLARIAVIREELKKLEHVYSPYYDRSLWAKKSDLIDEQRDLSRQDNATDFQTALTDLRLYRAQWQRILTASLYFLEIVHPGGKVYKIGVTTRPIEERIKEIYSDVTPLLGEVAIRLIDTWEHRGNVELYFKYKYKNQNAQIGNLTEYFSFADLGDITRDLRRMKIKALTPLEEEILRGDRTALELGAEAQDIEARRRAAIRAGMTRAAGKGQSIGRPRRTAPETPQEVLDRPYAAQVTSALEKGLSLRETAKAADVSVNTVRKVQAALAALQGDQK